jgi:hypothetical protein
VEEAGGWIAIGDLAAGEHLHSADGRSSVVTAVRHYSQMSPVYDLTVDDVHTYYVDAGTIAVLVHNCGPTGAAFPDRELPRTKHGEPQPDSSHPHTQLGQKSGRKGTYPQAREFDDEGNPVRDIDFTDHGRPADHENPHQHDWEPNPTGGSLKRGGPMRLVYP